MRKYEKRERNVFAATVMFDYAPDPTVPNSKKFQKQKHIWPQGFWVKDYVPVI